jgi:hypothetical protein
MDQLQFNEDFDALEPLAYFATSSLEWDGDLTLGAE